MAAYRVGSYWRWQALFELADHPHNFAAKDVLLATSRIWHAQDIFTEAMVATYRQRSTELARADEVERAALTKRSNRGGPSALKVSGTSRRCFASLPMVHMSSSRPRRRP